MLRTQEQTRKEQKIQSPERERLGSAGLTARMALDGVSLLDMPPQRLEELAGLLGNSAMRVLMRAQTLTLEEAAFHMPEGEPDTVPFQVPERQPLALTRPEGLTAAESAGVAADPAFLMV